MKCLLFPLPLLYGFRKRQRLAKRKARKQKQVTFGDCQNF